MEQRLVDGGDIQARSAQERCRFPSLSKSYNLFSGCSDLSQQTGSAKCNEHCRDHGQTGPSLREKQNLAHSGKTKSPLQEGKS